MYLNIYSCAQDRAFKHGMQSVIVAGTISRRRQGYRKPRPSVNFHEPSAVREKRAAREAGAVHIQCNFVLSRWQAHGVRAKRLFRDFVRGTVHGRREPNGAALVAPPAQGPRHFGGRILVRQRDRDPVTCPLGRERRKRRWCLICNGW